VEIINRTDICLICDTIPATAINEAENIEKQVKLVSLWDKI
jgi:hypothetical protein